VFPPEEKIGVFVTESRANGGPPPLCPFGELKDILRYRLRRVRTYSSDDRNCSVQSKKLLQLLLLSLSLSLSLLCCSQQTKSSSRTNTATGRGEFSLFWRVPDGQPRLPTKKMNSSTHSRFSLIRAGMRSFFTSETRTKPNVLDLGLCIIFSHVYVSETNQTSNEAPRSHHKKKKKFLLESL